MQRDLEESAITADEIATMPHAESAVTRISIGLSRRLRYEKRLSKTGGRLPFTSEIPPFTYTYSL
jgi:hypothetical protein